MGFVIKATQSSGAIYVGPAGLYDAEIVEVRKDFIEGGLYGSGDVVRFMCALDDTVDEKGEPAIIDATANLLLSPKSKLWGWLENLAIYPAIGNSVDLDLALGKRCVLSIVDNVRDGTTYSKVDGLFPAKVSRAQANMAEARAQLQAPPSAELVTATGAVNWTGFWAEAGRRQISRPMVADYVGGDINAITTMPVLDVLKILEDLRGL